MKRIVLTVVCTAVCYVAVAQSDLYLLMQGGANIGFANEGYKGAFNGYSAHFIFGRNFADRAYLGLGLGNEKLRGSYRSNDPHNDDQTSRKYDQNLFPIFVDGRLPIGEFGASSRIGLLANAGYAPRLSAMYDKGFLFKAGFFYLLERPGRTNWTASATYGYQQLHKNLHTLNKDFQHQHFNISIGLMLK